MALMSAKMPAPPEGSTPAMVREFGIISIYSTVQRLQQPFLGRAGISAVVLARDATSQEGFAACLHGELHGGGHEHWVARAGDCGVHEYAVAAQLHGNGGVGGSTYSGIHQHGHLSLVDDEAQVPG